MKKIKGFVILIVLCVACLSNAQVPPTPPFGCDWHTHISVTREPFIMLAGVSWGRLTNASDYTLYGGETPDVVTNLIINIQDNTVTNLFIFSTNQTYFYRVSANITN